MSEGVLKSAEISECGRYRYRLYRSWRDGPFVVFLMFNPSTADSHNDDHTICKCIGFARHWGYGGIAVVNLFAIRSTDPREVGKLPFAEAVGPLNDQAIQEVCGTAGEIILAWGCSQHMRKRLDRADKVVHSLRSTFPNLPIKCLGRSVDGQPRHPLMLPYTTPRILA